MSTKNKRKSNLKASLLLLLLTAVLLISSSYAWFTSNQTVTVSSLDVNVEAKNGLQISADGTNWKSILQLADITSVHNTTYTSSVNQVPAVLEPVSTAGHVDTDTGYLNMYYGEIITDADGNYLITATQSKETESNGTTSTGQFIVFDMFLQTQQPLDIYLTTDSNVISTDAASRGMENAARVAFLVEGVASAGSSISDIQGLKGATDATTYIWEPNCNLHTDNAITAAYDVYGQTITANTGADTTALSYAGVKAPITEDDAVKMVSKPDLHSTTYPTFFDVVTPAYKTISGFSTNKQIFSLAAGITKIRTYMWIEGQDVDCENNASGSNIQFNVQITSAT